MIMIKLTLSVRPSVRPQVLSLERDRGSFRERGSNFTKPSLTDFGPVVTNAKGDLAIQVTVNATAAA